jgi:site-specific DNA-cytosine methylase
MTLTVTDLLCGAGGSSHGAELAGFRAECQGVRGV